MKPLPLAVVDGATPDKINAALRTNLKNVARWSTPVAASGTGSGAAITVQHDLGTIPNMLHVEPYVDSRWWADQDDRKIWSATALTFHASHAGVFIVRAGVQ